MRIAHSSCMMEDLGYEGKKWTKDEGDKESERGTGERSREEIKERNKVDLSSRAGDYLSFNITICSI